MASKTKVDRRGVERGVCTNCDQCFEFYADTATILCGYCKCAPTQHKAEMQSDHAPETDAESCVDDRPSTDTKHSKIVDRPILRAEKGELLLN